MFDRTALDRLDVRSAVGAAGTRHPPDLAGGPQLAV
jgi:hypothetical protein